MTTVEIGPPLRQFCSDRKQLVGSGTNVLEVLLDATADHPALRSRILRNETEISSRVFVYGGDGSVIARDRESTAVAEGDTLRVYYFVAGG